MAIDIILSARAICNKQERTGNSSDIQKDLKLSRKTHDSLKTRNINN